mmetsp:Transcript_8096/g.16294  ORF Transcript_8096/g.16294 Transcript_8096/m.16294 type:complete len:314 (+) Transcript_8096:1015-1956(+)
MVDGVAHLREKRRRRRLRQKASAYERDLKEPETSKSDSENSQPPSTTSLENGEDDDAGSDVEAQFEFFDPCAGDLGDVSGLLGSFCRGTGIDSQQLAQAVCAQTRVGTTVRADPDGPVLGLVTMLNLSTQGSMFQPILGKLSIAERGRWSDVLDGSVEVMGFFICERVVNLPLPLIPWMQQAVFDEVRWAQEDEPDEEQRHAFNLSSFLYSTQAFMRPQRTSKRRKSSSSLTDQLVLTQPEDHIIMEYASMVASWDDPLDSRDAPLPEELEGLSRTRLLLKVPFSAASMIQARTKAEFPQCPRLDEIEMDMPT